MSRPLKYKKRSQQSPMEKTVTSFFAEMGCTGVQIGSTVLKGPKVKPVKPKKEQPCHSDNDGDCNWKKCPQLKDYKEICPLWKDPDEV